MKKITFVLLFGLILTLLAGCDISFGRKDNKETAEPAVTEAENEPDAFLELVGGIDLGAFIEKKPTYDHSPADIYTQEEYAGGYNEEAGKEVYATENEYTDCGVYEEEETGYYRPQGSTYTPPYNEEYANSYDYEWPYEEITMFFGQYFCEEHVFYDISGSELVELLTAYASSSQASERANRLILESDRIVPLQICGPKLEESDLWAVLFYNGDGLEDLIVFQLDGSVSPMRLAEMTDEIVEFAYDEDDNVETAMLSSIKHYSELYPTFDFEGIRIDEKEGTYVLPFGYCEGENTLKYLLGEPCEFECVEPFKTVEEGREKYRAYLEHMDKLRGEMRRFKWSNHITYVDLDGYIPVFKANAHLYGISESEIEYLSSYDEIITLPLLDVNGKTHVNLLHLIYYRGKLIAEVVLSDKYLSPYTVEWQNVSEKNASGEYIGIDKPLYVKVMNAMKALDPSFKPKNVIFAEGKFIPFMIDGETMICFDFDGNRFVTLVPSDEETSESEEETVVEYCSAIETGDYYDPWVIEMTETHFYEEVVTEPATEIASACETETVEESDRFSEITTEFFTYEIETVVYEETSTPTVITEIIID